MTNKIILGKILSPIGLQGNVKCYLHSDEPTWLDREAEIDGSTHTLICLKHPYSGNKKLALCKISQIDHINHLQPFIGKEFSINRSLLPELDEDNFYINDIIDYDIIYNNKNHGKVKYAHDFGSGVILENDSGEFIHTQHIENMKDGQIFIKDGVLD
jgi:16S rRNA processing protein RimM